MLISPLNAFPWVLNGLVEAWVSLKRVQQFLLLPELDLSQYYISEGIYEEPDQGCELVAVTGGSFTWKREEEREEVPGVVEWLLKGVDVTIRKVRERERERSGLMCISVGIICWYSR